MADKQRFTRGTTTTEYTKKYREPGPPTTDPYPLAPPNRPMGTFNDNSKSLNIGGKPMSVHGPSSTPPSSSSGTSMGSGMPGYEEQ